MAVVRKRAGRFRVPEDITKFGGEVHTDINNDWSLGGRINRCLANDVDLLTNQHLDIDAHCGFPAANRGVIRKNASNRGFIRKLSPWVVPV
ncbi:unnamed protein product [Didymodactylos carnosus]|uniref:Uncharacterized protein n=1 Tax=Didymodactylos carnosus TaxID=1234261 RepID=A0A814X5C1_9BILA|nr:unnamed protein product [Didymodactylos carnosus]CAF1209639.1 unnamed protein product [Didymodactylos carnosus]CAF3807136.1 unnamed protein product [Didymodactylos carnosus]CAF3973734.1 unnamed protein product [Didymodactylos carnosus]